MPHVVIEYSANVADHHDVGSLVRSVHSAALSHGLAAPSALRTRAVERTHFQVADGREGFAFVALHVRVGPGRDDAEKRSFIETLLNSAVDAVQPTPLAIAWSIELTEIDPEMRINRNFVRPVMEGS